MQATPLQPTKIRKQEAPYFTDLINEHIQAETSRTENRKRIAQLL